MRGVRHIITHYFQKKSREVLELEALLEAQARRKKLEEQERMQKSFDETRNFVECALERGVEVENIGAEVICLDDDDDDDYQSVHNGQHRHFDYDDDEEEEEEEVEQEEEFHHNHHDSAIASENVAEDIYDFGDHISTTTTQVASSKKDNTIDDRSIGRKSRAISTCSVKFDEPWENINWQI